MSKTYLPYDPDQQLLLPAALQEWMPQDHLAYFISDVVDQLDLSAITARDEDEKRGGPPYHPRMMVKVLLYGYCTGVASSRRMAQRLREDIAFRVLAANNTPYFRTVSDFRKDHLEALADLFLQMLELCCQGCRQNIPVGRSKSVPPERSLAGVNVRASCSGEVSQRQAGSRLGE